MTRSRKPRRQKTVWEIMDRAEKMFQDEPSEHSARGLEAVRDMRAAIDRNEAQEAARQGYRVRDLVLAHIDDMHPIPPPPPPDPDLDAINAARLLVRYLEKRAKASKGET